MDRKLPSLLRISRPSFPFPGTRLRSAFALIATLFAVSSLYGAAPNKARITNFGQVNASIYRGAAPTPLGLQDLNAMGVKLVIDLRESGRETLDEKSVVERLGMKYINVPLAPWSAPTPEKIQTVLELLGAATNTQPMFVHCRRGKDRTGTVVACYRIRHDRWTREQAIEEANRYGMSWTERGMRSFVAHFAPLPLMPAAGAH